MKFPAHARRAGVIFGRPPPVLRHRGGWFATCPGRKAVPSPFTSSCVLSPLALLVVAVSMSVDAFAASLAKGAALHRPRLSEALRTGAGYIGAMGSRRTHEDRTRRLRAEGVTDAHRASNLLSGPSGRGSTRSAARSPPPPCRHRVLPRRRASPRGPSLPW